MGYLFGSLRERASGRMHHRSVQSIDLYRTSRPHWYAPPTTSKHFGPCYNLSPTRLTPGQLPPGGRLWYGKSTKLTGSYWVSLCCQCLQTNLPKILDIVPSSKKAGVFERIVPKTPAFVVSKTVCCSIGIKSKSRYHAVASVLFLFRCLLI